MSMALFGLMLEPNTRDWEVRSLFSGESGAWEAQGNVHHHSMVQGCTGGGTIVPAWISFPFCPPCLSSLTFLFQRWGQTPICLGKC